jgi:hypothetical protein
MTFSTRHTKETPMASTSKVFRATGLVAVALALTAPAAQAKPMGFVVNSANASPAKALPTLSEPGQPIQVATPASSSSSFDWADAGVGAGAAAALLGLAGVAGTRVRRRPPLAQS